MNSSKHGPSTQKTLTYMRRMIGSNKWTINEPTPSIGEIAKRATVSYPTARKAMFILEREHVIENHGPLGFFVKRPVKTNRQIASLRKASKLLLAAEKLNKGGIEIAEMFISYDKVTKIITAYNIVSGEEYTATFLELYEAKFNPVCVDQIILARRETYRKKLDGIYNRQREIRRLADLVVTHKKDLGIK